MERMIIRGDEKDIITELSKYIEPDDAKIVVRSLPAFRDLIDDDETLQIEREIRTQKNVMEFIIPKTNYYINLKITTIAFIAFLLDLKFTKGFAAFIMSIFGVTADAIRKLSDTEKCVLLLVKADAVLTGEDEYMLRDSAPCVNYVRKCDCHQYDRCSLPKEVLTATVEKLLDKNIIKQEGSLLVYRF